MDRPFASSPVTPSAPSCPETTGPLASWHCKWSCAQQERRGPLDPDVLLGDRAVAPLRQSHHPATVLELADHAGPVSGAEPDRMGLDLDWRATGALDECLHCLDVLTNATRRSLPVDIHEHLVSVVT